jgi:protoporphyrinogen oxidase
VSAARLDLLALNMGPSRVQLERTNVCMAGAMIPHVEVAIIGAGPAGLSAAHALVQCGVDVLVLEKAHTVGGIARTELHNGYRFDIGGHRFFTKLPSVQHLWEETLGEDFLTVTRRSHIYYGGHFLRYPLELSDALRRLGPWESLLVLLSYLRARLRPEPNEESLDRWLINRFGRRLYSTFFKAYTEKVWGRPCHEIRSDWAAQRIRGLSLTAAAANAVFGTNNAKSLIRGFQYPRLGPGQMWQGLCQAVQDKGGLVWLNAKVVGLERSGERISRLVVRRDGRTEQLSAGHIISSMPLGELASQLEPAPPQEVLEASRNLTYRDFVLVGLVLSRARPFDDNWIYVHSPDVQVGRVQNCRNWSAAMVPDPGTVSLGMEYFCTAGDDLWRMADGELIALAGREIEQLGLAKAADTVDGVVFRQPKAYPIYDHEYREHVALIRGFLASIRNLQTIGRNGLHRYNNMDHSVLTGMLAARNALGEAHDLWAVNTEQAYHEHQL